MQQIKPTQSGFIKSAIIVLGSLFFIGTVSAQEKEKIPVKPVEPFYRQISVDAPKIYEPKVTYLSPEKKSPIIFSSLGATWNQQLPEATSIVLEVRFKSNGKYSDWYLMEPSIDEKYGSSKNQSLVSSFLTTKEADGYQYRIALNSLDPVNTPVLENLKFTFINGGSPAEKTELLVESHQSAQNTDLISSVDQVAQAEPVVKLITPVRTRRQPAVKSNSTNTKLKIIKRSEWGADESLRVNTPVESEKEPDLVEFEDDYYTKYASELKESKRITTDENGNLLTWPLSYPESIKKIVIHHTATTKDLEDPKKAIRDIYMWHTKSKGWGDIGYNYIIDQQGNIYEGRYGGEMVVGAHAGRGNHGSIGIALLGNYQENEPPEAVTSALTSLIREKARLYNIDTEGAALFRGESYPNIMGHRDIMSTSCPGDKVYALLPVIRKLAKVATTSTSKAVISDYDFNWASGNPPVVSFSPKGKKLLKFKLKNTGKLSWDSNTYFKVKSSENARTFLRNSGEILSSTVGKTIKPGEIAEVEMMTFAMSTSGAGLIELQPVISGKTIDKSLSFGLQVTTPAPKEKYDYELVSIMYDRSEFKKGDTIGVKVRLRNKGTSPWQKAGNNKLMLGADKPRDHINSLLVNPSNRLSGLNEDLIKTGETGTFSFQIKVPQEDGVYREYFTPVVEGIQWMQNRSTYLEIRIGKSNKIINPLENPTEADGKSTAPSTPASNAGVTTANPTPTGSTAINIASTKLDTTVQPRNIRISLSYRGNPATISANGEFYLYEGPKKIATFSKDQLATVKYENNIFKITANNQTYSVSSRPRFVPSTDTIMRIDNWERRNTWGDKANNNEFRGVLEALIYKDELNIINELPLEDYLKGISEEPVTEPDEKIKSIMVIARTYARFYMDVTQKFPGAPFDLTDDPSNSQKYTGYSYEKRAAKITEMVLATAGQYVTYQGKLIKTPFFSRSDGKRTKSAKENWGWTDAPFLLSVDDSLCQSTEFAGHGVGLSGCGATAMAKLGKTYQEIIKYYYTGVEITQANY